ncbi:hypothetical protein KCU87_g28, partial [Aureobasidium melanogenum]
MSSCSLGISSSTVPPFEALAAPKSVLTVLKRKFEVCRYSWVACQSKGKTSRNRITMDPKNIFFDPCGRLPMLKMKFIAIVDLSSCRVNFRIRKRTSNEVECQIEVAKREPGECTSVSPVACLTYFNTHDSLRLATSSQQRIRSSARYMLAVNTSAS